MLEIIIVRVFSWDCSSSSHIASANIRDPLAGRAPTWSFFWVGVPPRIGPPPALPNKDFGHSARTRGSFAVNLEFHDIAAPNDGDIAKVLNFGAGEFKPDKLSTFGMKFNGSSNYVGLVLPFSLSPTHDYRLGRHEFLESFVSPANH